MPLNSTTNRYCDRMCRTIQTSRRPGELRAIHAENQEDARAVRPYSLYSYYNIFNIFYVGAGFIVIFVVKCFALIPSLS